EERVLVVGEEDARERTFGIEHVVIPMPGKDVRFPTNEVGRTMLRVLQEDGLEEVVLEGHAQPAFVLHGAYRHVVAFPKGLRVCGTGWPESWGSAVGRGGDRMSLPGTVAWLREAFGEGVKDKFGGGHHAA
ncbi:unnamed protein product, partial [Discosporangium mesarthrocarpum]